MPAELPSPRSPQGRSTQTDGQVRWNVAHMRTLPTIPASWLPRLFYLIRKQGSQLSATTALE